MVHAWKLSCRLPHLVGHPLLVYQVVLGLCPPAEGIGHCKKKAWNLAAWILPLPEVEAPAKRQQPKDVLSQWNATNLSWPMASSMALVLLLGTGWHWEPKQL